jgi:hypothetical protein
MNEKGDYLMPVIKNGTHLMFALLLIVSLFAGGRPIISARAPGESLLRGTGTLPQNLITPRSMVQKRIVYIYAPN